MDFLKEFELIEERSNTEETHDNTLTDEELKAFLEDIKVIGNQNEKRARPAFAKENLEKLLYENLKPKPVREKRSSSFLKILLTLLCFATLGMQFYFFNFLSKKELDTQALLIDIHREISSLRDELKDVEFTLENPSFPEDEIIEPLPEVEGDPLEIPHTSLS